MELGEIVSTDRPSEMGYCTRCKRNRKMIIIDNDQFDRCTKQCDVCETKLNLTKFHVIEGMLVDRGRLVPENKIFPKGRRNQLKV